MSCFTIMPIIIPVLFGVLISILPFRKRRYMEFYIFAVVVINTVLTWILILSSPEGSFQALNLAGRLEVTFRVDGLSSLFAGMISILWPFATLYAFSYMKHYEKVKVFYSFYTMTFGVTLGIAFASNLMTLYMFYEMLTLVTLPLVMFSMKKKNIRAGRKYVYYSIGGAAFAFIGFILIFSLGSTMNFEFGGVLDPSKTVGKENLIRFIYVLSVLGFGVKSAIFPIHGWLPTASIAPTPVTALLHAVAVVKAGAFAIIGITYYSFGIELLKGSWAQYTVLAFATFTIVFGSAMAWKETHLKRRLAYSTVSNLSYIVFGAALMSPEGMVGGMTHMIFHAFMKITLFFCAGAVLAKTKKEYVYELHGIGRIMPVTMVCFSLSSLGVIGIPPFSGFVSKWYLAAAAMEEGSVAAYIGITVLLISALLTAIYLLKVVILAFFPKESEEEKVLGSVDEADKRMLLPITLFTAVTLGLGCASAPLISFLGDIASGLI